MKPAAIDVSTTGMPIAPDEIKSRRDSLKPTEIIPARRMSVVQSFSPGEREGGREMTLLAARPNKMETGMPEIGMASAVEIAEDAAKETVVTEAAAAIPGMGLEGGASLSEEKFAWESSRGDRVRRWGGVRRPASLSASMREFKPSQLFLKKEKSRVFSRLLQFN